MVNGRISSPWDDGHDLAESLNILLQERSDSDIPELDSDIRPYLADYNKKHQTEYVNAMPYGRFMEVIPVHESCDGPGTAWDFQWRIRGDVAHLLRRLSDGESKAMQHDEREWASLAIGAYKRRDTIAATVLLLCRSAPGPVYLDA